MGRDYQKMNVSELVPYELAITGTKLSKAKKNLKPKGFTEPVKVFELEGHWFVRDGTHRCVAATELGIEEVPVQEVFPPDDVSKVRDEIEQHLALKGFRNMPTVSGLSNRVDAPFKIDKDAVLEHLKKQKDEQS